MKRNSLLIFLSVITQFCLATPVRAQTEWTSFVDFLNSFMAINIHIQNYDIERFNYNAFEFTEPYGYWYKDPRPYADFIAIGDSNPYTEAQLLEMIASKSPYQGEPHFVIGDGGYALNYFRDVVEYNIARAFYRDSSQTHMEQIFIFIDPPVDRFETETAVMNHYVVKDHLMTEELQVTGEISSKNVTEMHYTQTTPKSYEAIQLTPEEVENYIAQPDNIQALFDRLGVFHSHHVRVLETDLVDTLTWVDLGHSTRRENDTNIASLSITFPSASNPNFAYEIQLISE